MHFLDHELSTETFCSYDSLCMNCMLAYVQVAPVRRDPLLPRRRPAEEGLQRRGHGGGARSKMVPTDFARVGVRTQQGESRQRGNAAIRQAGGRSFDIGSVARVLTASTTVVLSWECVSVHVTEVDTSRPLSLLATFFGAN